LSLEGRELKAKSSILRRHGRRTAEEEPRKTKQEQGEGRRRPRFLGHMPMKVKPLSANRILANHNILEVYEKPYDPKQPVVCLDEKSVTLHADVRPSSAAAPGREARQDSEYERWLSSHCFFGDQPEGPPAAPAFGRITADHGDNPLALLGIQQTLRSRALFVIQGVFQPGLSQPHHFARMFRHSTGQSVHRYVIRRPFKRAERLLWSNISQVGGDRRSSGLHGPEPVHD
jgi:hypothetical protein